MIGSPDKVGAFGARQFSQIVYQSVIPNSGPNENKCTGYLLSNIHITQLIFPWYSETSNPILFLHDCLKPEISNI
jgi:hypothetical protein